MLLERMGLSSERNGDCFDETFVAKSEDIGETFHNLGLMLTYVETEEDKKQEETEEDKVQEESERETKEDENEVVSPDLGKIVPIFIAAILLISGGGLVALIKRK